MATDLGILTVLGLFANYLFTKLKLPGLLGMLLLGILIGPYGVDLLSPELMSVSSDFREIALIVILLRAGLGLDWDELKKVGKPALKLSFIPGIFEGLSIMMLSTSLLGLSMIEGGMLGFIIAAVSPAVVVPSMLELKDRKIGTDKGIPTMILAGASLDDIVAITIFSGFLGLYGGQNINIVGQLLKIPLSIVTGVLLGAVVGLVFVWIFRKYHIRDTKKVIMITGAAILIMELEDLLAGTIPLAGLLSVMTIGFIILLKRGIVAKRLSVKFNKIWVLAEILLFVLVGAQVNIHVALGGGAVALIVIFLGLLSRSIGVLVSLIGTRLNYKEKLFCAVAYIPKATVQAAIGAVPLASGVASGDTILAAAVLAIIVTAPLGAIGIRVMEPMLEKES
jgi:NhaP-type Na+/H+ or K+/H+ antiporter